jgi:hypothetical protein
MAFDIEHGPFLTRFSAAGYGPRILQLQYATHMGIGLHIETESVEVPMFATIAALLLGGVTDGAYFRAEPAVAPAQGRVIAGEVAWRCGPEACVAGNTGARPVVQCQGLVRAVGKVKSFAVAGAALPADQLEKCNAHAR